MKKISLFLILSLRVLSFDSQAALEISPVFGDHMVLQRNKPIPVWGSADTNATVSVEFSGRRLTTKADSNGKWLVKLPAIPANNTALTMTITSGTNKLTIGDVLVGEVWICSGQSNMEWSLVNAKNGKEEVANANHPQIRLLQVARKIASYPETTLGGSWKICNPDTATNFSAVGYFFGRELNRKLNIPVGLINASWGGTPAEAWTRSSTLEGDADYTDLLDKRSKRIFTSLAEQQSFQEKADREQKEWDAKISALLAKPGTPDPQWFTANPAGIKDWKTFNIPGSIEKGVGIKADGSFWIRREFDVSASAANGEAVLMLGAIDDYDFTWVNGKLVGMMGAEESQAWNTPRKYPLPADMLHPGKNVIVIRVIDRREDCLIRGSSNDQHIVAANGEIIQLAGLWQGRLETNIGIYSNPTQGLQNITGTLYDGMIAPLIPYSIRGVIWYQGESNASRAKQYQKLFPHLITNWRQDWQQGDFPFYFVQLANFMAHANQPSDSNWAELREAQLMALSLPNTGMAVTIDIGEAGDIHPRNKQEVSRRLSLIALSRDYGMMEKSFLWFKKPLEFSGPIYRDMVVSGSRAILSFNHVGKGLTSLNKDGELSGFAISGDGENFVWAKAVIAGDKVIVSADGIDHPVAIRYGWADNPLASLYNADGLPASPFRTDYRK